VTDREAIVKLATSWTELVWFWGGFAGGAPHAHMFKSWFDREDTWRSMLDNAHNQIRIAEYQRPGCYNMPDYLTVGQGAQTAGQYRAQMFLWVVLGAPLFLGNDIRAMNNATLDLITHPELLAMNADDWGLQGSQTQALDASEVWVKPIERGAAFAVAIVNKSPSVPANVTLNFVHWSDFFPAAFPSAAVRDVYARADLGVATGALSVAVAPMDGRMLRVAPIA
jgi:alpha-galactosidase